MARAAGPLILLCNDDGYLREGIQVLFRRLRPLGQTVIVAPDRERSACSLALTLRQPLRLHRVKPDIWTVDGTPADCIYFALQKVLPRRPDLLISGMNPGPNLGQSDVHYSGTVAAALQGTFCGIPSLAVSLIADPPGRVDIEPAARIVRRIAERVLTHGLPEGVTLNINIPAPPVRGVRITRLGKKFYNPEVIEKKDPRGQAYYWVGTGTPSFDGGPDTDIRATEQKYISITPLQADLTCGAFARRDSFLKLRKGILSD
ncbi:MAG: 5'/3'-nucleotidase SurE [Candidatus Aminicenantales bacterium]